MRGSTSSALLLTATSALAQNSTSNSTSSCSTEVQWFNAGNATVNSTGIQEFKWNATFAYDIQKEPWYLSVLINDTGRGEFNGGVEGRGYISVPEGLFNNTQVCAYQLGSLNATLETPGPGENSCKGALSGECMYYLNTHLRSLGGGRCPDFDQGQEEARQAYYRACPELKQKGIVRDGAFREMNNDTCAFTDLPGVDIPDNYISFGTPSVIDAWETFNWESNVTQAYDLMVRQVVPYILLGNFQDPVTDQMQTAIEYICVVANRTVEGSRVPQGEVPWNAGSALQTRMWVVVAGVAAAVLAM